MGRLFPPTLARDAAASVVVFLVAMPLCMGIAVASGVPAEKGLLTGIIGGLVVGLFAGSPLQVSGPAAGLAVIVFEIVREQGIGALGPVLVIAGLVQVLAGLLRLGGWFRAISPAVVHGMLAGIGVLIVAGQAHMLLDAKPLPNGLQNLAALPEALLGLLPPNNSSGGAALLVGTVTIAGMLGWERLRPRALRLVPGALVGVVAGVGIATLLAVPVKRVEVPGAIWDSIALPADLSRFLEPGLLLTALAVAFIASAETLLSASAVDRMHDGPRTRYDKELAAQGVGNLLCGLIGALPMTGVIVRSSANVQAGAATRLSTILHGTWILGAVVLVPGLLNLVPMAALAGVLVVTGVRLVSVRHARDLFQKHGALPAAVWAATLFTVVAVDLLTGVLVGLALAVVELLPHLSRLGLRLRQREVAPGRVRLTLVGSATFLQLPRLMQALEAVPPGSQLQLRAGWVRYFDHTCLEAVAEWAARRRKDGATVQLDGLSRRRHRRLAELVSGAVPAH